MVLMILTHKIRGLTPPARRVYLARRSFALSCLFVLALLCHSTKTCAAPPAKARISAPPSADDEWPELDPKSPRRAFLDAAYADADDEPRGISQVQLSRWLLSLPGPNYRLMETNRGKGSVAGFEGTARLLAPWPADAVLSIAPFDHHTMAIYFWNGREGVSLHYYQHPRPTWAAYRTTRKESEPQPATFSLLATDNEAYGRSLGGALEIRHQVGNFVVNRGSMRLLTFPCAALPTEVFFDKRAWFRTFTMYRAEPVPDDLATGQAAAAVPSVLGKTSPAALDWTILPADGSRLILGHNEKIELTSDVMAATTWAGLKVPRPGLYEIVCRLGEASAATGFYLGDDAGKPLYVLGIVRDQRTRQPVLQYLQPNAGGFEIGTDINQLQVPFIGPGQWLRLITGSGTIKCWTSGDGVHWSRVLDPLRGLRGGWSHVGLMSFKWNEPRRITLEHLRISELAAVSQLADEKLCAQVPAAVVTEDPNPPAWQARVNDSIPAGIDMALWRNACASRTVAAIPPSQLGNVALNGLADEIIVQKIPAARRMHALDQIAELYDGWEPPDSFRLSQFYERLGKQLMREGDRRPWTEVGRFLATAPISTHAQFQTVHESLANAELFFLIYSEEWNGVRQLCRELTFLNRPGPPEQSWPDNRQRIKLLVEWSRATADRDRSDRDRFERTGSDKPRQANSKATIPFHWQHPLVANLSKEGFNTLSDLEATLAEKSYREACQIISSARPELTTGLLPDGADARLLLSLPQAVEMAMRDDPALRETMVEQFGTTGRLRLQQALANGNALQVQALTVQFSGTPAAGAAHEWLGKRALEIGDFAWAMAEFEYALRSAEREQRPSIAAHWRLAAALLGRDASEPPTEPVVFQSTRLEPDAFEKLVAEMKLRAIAKGQFSAAIAEAAPRVGVKAVRYDIVQRASLRGDVGDQPGNPISGEVDWPARQIGSTIAANMLYVTNRFQVSAINLKTGQQFWSQPVGKEQGSAHSWGLCPSRPVVVGDSLLVRRLAKANPELVCFNIATGIVRWTTRNTVIVISDPVVVQDRLFVFTTTSNESGLISIDFSLVDPASGEIVAQQPVIQLRNVWDRQLSCQAAVVGTHIVALCGGTALCCDFAGRPLWVRRQQWIPPTQAPAANEQSPNVPLVIGNRLFVSQPGVFAVECLDLDTGRRVWQEPIPDLRRLIGIAGPRLVIETARGWQAHAPDSGKVLWQHDGEQILDAQVCPASGDLLVAQREFQQGDQWRAVLVWLSAETGRETARQPLAPFVDKQPMLGPLVVDGDHIWTFFGRGVKDPYRDLFELTPTADPAQAPRTASIGQ